MTTSAVNPKCRCTVFSFPFDDKSGRQVGWVFEINVLFIHRYIILLNTVLFASAPFRHLQTPRKIKLTDKQANRK
jgi:hypothetical protein